MRRSNEYADERINKESNKVTSKFFVFVVLLTCIEIIVKYVFISHIFYDYILELVSIIGAIGYILFHSIRLKVPLIKKSDECMNEIQNSIRAHAFGIISFIFILGEFILFYLYDELIIPAMYIPIWFIPSTILTINIVQKGLFIWGSKKREQVGLNKFKISTVIGSLFYGCIMSWNKLVVDGRFQPKGILLIIFLAILWGVPFYLVMKYLISKSEKLADIEVEKLIDSEVEKVNNGKDYEQLVEEIKYEEQKAKNGQN